MSEIFKIQSYKGPYCAWLAEDLTHLDHWYAKPIHILIDAKVLELHKSRLQPYLAKARTVTPIHATEDNKDARKSLDIAEKLAASGLRRGHSLLAIGGGIIQDITCFLASTMLRGIDWYFLPTTLLAQADSCIGSKSSINLGSYKNLLGTFCPPREVGIISSFRETLSLVEIQSGIGEMIKVHALSGRTSVQSFASRYFEILSKPSSLSEAILQSLKIKRKFIEDDEFDTGIRNLLNYGHSFGHAIESATKFAIPHGIAVTIGMDMANFVSARLGIGPESYFHDIHDLMAENSISAKDVNIPLTPFLDAIGKDKKNTDDGLVLIMPTHHDLIEKVLIKSAEIQTFTKICGEYLWECRGQKET